MPINMNQLYSKNPGTSPAKPAATVESPNASAATATGRDATAQQAASATANAAKVQMGNVPKVDEDLNRITSQDSLYLKDAKQGGMLTAASRGLQNSSIAAGASQREAVKAGLPMAQQNVDNIFKSEMLNAENQQDTNFFNAQTQTDVSKFNAELGTSVDVQNAAQANEISKLNAQLESAVAEGNADRAAQVKTRMAELATSINQFNAEQTNQMRAQVLQANADLNKQFLAGEQAMSLADIQGQYNQLISSNETAARMYDSYFQGIAQAMAQPEMSPGRIASYVKVQQSMLTSGLKMMDEMNGLDLSDFQMPNVGSNRGNFGRKSIGQGSLTVSNPQPRNPDLPTRQPLPVGDPSELIGSMRGRMAGMGF